MTSVSDKPTPNVFFLFFFIPNVFFYSFSFQTFCGLSSQVANANLQEMLASLLTSIANKKSLHWLKWTLDTRNLQEYIYICVGHRFSKSIYVGHHFSKSIYLGHRFCQEQQIKIVSICFKIIWLSNYVTFKKTNF